MNGRILAELKIVILPLATGVGEILYTFFGLVYIIPENILNLVLVFSLAFNGEILEHLPWTESRKKFNFCVSIF